MEITRLDFWERLVRARALLLLVAQGAILTAGTIYLFVRGADVGVVALIVTTLYSLTPASADRASVPAAVVAWLQRDRSTPGLSDRDLRAS